MFRDIAMIDQNETLRTAFCIVGAGVAGITLARRLADAGHDILLLEGGFETPQEESQDLYNIRTRGKDCLPIATRIRTFGGSSYHWAGQCWPLDDTNFAQRE